MPDQPPFILVDGSSYLFRAYHALPPLTNSKGEPTGAIVGVINMLRKLINEYHPRHMAVVFDTPGKTFRHDLYPEYKANRPPAPEDLVAQIDPLYEIVRAMGLPLLLVQGVEADDVIGTLARQAAEQGMETLISTGDKDMAQLVDDHVTLINTMSDTVTDVQGVKDKYGVAPEQIIDYLALMGDAADNIPGVHKCGPKTAAKWLQQYGSLDQVIAHADEFKGKIGEYLREGLEQLPLSRQLATIDTGVPLDWKPSELLPAQADVDRLRQLYTSIEARRLLDTLEEPEAPVTAPLKTHYETILNQQQYDAWLEKLEAADLLAVDTETTSLDYMQASIVGLSFSVREGEAAYLPLAHDYPGAPDQLDRDSVLSRLQPLLEDPHKHKVGQNLKYDMSVLARHGIELRGIAYDTMLESYVLDPTGSRHNMDALAEKYLAHKTVKYEEIAGKGAKQLSFNQVHLEQAAFYAAEDADVTLRLHRVLWPQLEQEPKQAELLTSMEIPLVAVLSRMERNGVQIDQQMLRDQGQDLAGRMQQLEQQAYEKAGHKFNLNSPRQIGQVFFEEQEMEVIAKTPKGVPSTAESVLQELAERGYELPAIILEHRGLAKLKSTYIDKLPGMVDPDSGRLHTSYHQAVTATGRLSSSDPNLQNIPIRNQDGRRIRKAFTAEQGASILAADYSQIELRIMAHLSGDTGLGDAFSRELDVHAATAAEVFDVDSVAAVTSDQRRSAKAINFGLIYGMSAFGLARQLGIGRNEAQDYVDRYFSRYPGVRDYMEATRAQAHELGYVETLFGRRLYLPEINARNKQRQAAAERTAINAPMQGTAADIIKKAMIAVDSWIQQEAPPVKMIMQVHDELVFEVVEEQAEAVKEKIVQFMESAASLSVPLRVDAAVGRNWEEAH